MLFCSYWICVLHVTCVLAKSHTRCEWPHVKANNFNLWKKNSFSSFWSFYELLAQLDRSGVSSVKLVFSVSKAVGPCTYSLKKKEAFLFHDCSVVTLWPPKLTSLLFSPLYSTVGDSPDGGERHTLLFLQCL